MEFIVTKARLFILILLFTFSTLVFSNTSSRINFFFVTGYFPYGQGMMSNYTNPLIPTNSKDWFQTFQIPLELLANGEPGLVYGRELNLTRNFKIFLEGSAWTKIVRGMYGLSLSAGLGIGALELFGGYDGFYDLHYLGNVLIYKSFYSDDAIWNPRFGHGLRVGARINHTSYSYWGAFYTFGLNNSLSYLNFGYGLKLNWSTTRKTPSPSIDPLGEEVIEPLVI